MELLELNGEVRRVEPTDATLLVHFWYFLCSKTRYDGPHKMDWLPIKRFLPIIIDDQSSGSIWLFLMIDYEISAENIPQNSQASHPD